MASLENIKNFITHNGVFHADEVFALAILKVFLGINPEVIRTRDNNIISEAKASGDLVVDVGGEFNGVNLFDHHQDSALKSSAGLIWELVENSANYPDISELISIIDDNDRGVAKAAKFSISWSISRFNRGPETADADFGEAVEFAVKMLSSMKIEEEKKAEAAKIVEEAEIVSPDVIILKKYNNQWRTVVNGENPKYSHIKRVVWFNEINNQWNVQVPGVSVDSFELNGDKLLPCESMVFVHANGFFAVSATLEIMKAYLKI